LILSRPVAITVANNPTPRELVPSPLIVQMMLELARSSGQGSCEGPLLGVRF
jgi:hypothetical protein